MLGRVALSALCVGQLWPVPSPDLTTLIRDRAVLSLAGYPLTLDGRPVPVEAERIDVVETGATPRVIVYADENATSKSRGGTAPAFDVTMQMVVQCLVSRATRADAVADIDALIAQVKDGLLRDPNWVKLMANVHSFRVQRSFKPEGDLIIGDGRLLIEGGWTEIYRPRVSQPLSTITLTTTPPAGTPAIAAGVTLT